MAWHVLACFRQSSILSHEPNIDQGPISKAPSMKAKCLAFGMNALHFLLQVFEMHADHQLLGLGLQLH